MKKFYFKNLLATIAMTTLVWGNACGQVSAYTFAQTSGTYTAITGGTAHNTTQTDNANYSFTLPFTFTYNGTGYSVARPTTNGFLVLGANAPSTSQYTPLSSGTTNFAISAFGFDLRSIVRSEVIGTSPNRIYVCQWSSVDRWASSAWQADAMNFQIRLYETTNVIEIIYGSNSGTATSSTVQVGLRGSASTDFNTRTSTTSWSSTTVGSANTSTLTYSSTVKPTSGQTYTWTPPACPNLPTSLTSNTITATTANIAWTAASPAPGSGYEYYVSTSSTAPTAGTTPTGTVGAGVVTAALSSLSSNTQYYFWVRSNCNGTDKSGWAGSGTFTTLCAAIASYPFTEGFEAASSTRSCWSQVQMAGSGTWTYATGAGGGTVTTAQSGSLNARFVSESGTATPVTRLVSPVFDLTTLSAPRLRFYYAQEDWSGDQNETKVYYRTSSGGAWTQIAHYTGNVAAWTQVTLTLPSPSATYQVAFEGINNYGRANVIDNVVVEESPSCLTPTIAATTSITSTTATINWTAPSSPPAGGYIYEVRSSGAAGSGSTGRASTGTTAAGVVTASITGLSPATAYKVYVRSYCAVGDTSAWTSATTGDFTTACAALSLPWFEGFESVSVGTTVVGTATSLPPCWNSQSTQWSSSNATTYNNAQQGTQYIRYAWSTTNAFLWTPGFQLTAGTSYDFSFYAQGDGYTTWINDIFVNSSQNATGATQLTPSFSPTGPGSQVIQSYNKIIRTFTPSSTGTYYFAIRGNQSSSTPWYMAFDSFYLQQTPAPTITSVTSSQTCHDTTKITIIGTNLGSATAASINGVSLGTLDSNTSTRIVRYMPTPFTSGGNVSVTNVGGTATFANTFSFTNPPALSIDSPNFTICKGTSAVVSLTSTPSNFSTYTWSAGVSGSGTGPWTFTPSATTTYHLTATGSGCTRIISSTVTMADTPSRLTLSQGMSKTNCSERIDSLMVSGGFVNQSGKIGSGTAANTLSTPFKRFWGGSRSQALYTPAELTALGLVNGSQISSLGWVALSGTPAAMGSVTGFSIAAGFVSASTLGTAFISGASNTVLAPAVYTPTTGVGNLDFSLSTPLTWNGTSHLLVETCFNDNDGGGVSANSISVESTTVASGLNLYLSQDNNATVCTNTTAPTSTTARPNLRLTYSVPNVTWSPTTGIFTNSAATTPYSSGHAAKLYTKNTSTTKYYAQSQLGNCIVRDSIIDSANTAANMVTLASTSAASAVAQCTDGGWTYYGTAANPDKLIFAIQKGSSGLTGESVSITIDGTNFSNFSSNGANQEHKSIFMKRSWDVTATPGFTPPVNVRFFYDATDSSDVVAARDADSVTLKGSNPNSLLRNTPFTWFKSKNTAYTTWRSTNVRGNQFTAGTYDILTPLGYGTQNGIRYVEFAVSSFSGGTGGAGFGPSGGGGGGVGLPVTWAGFEIETTEAGNELTWKTASEQNTSHFEVEYSYDAIQWSVVNDQIAAAGNSADLRTYTFTHSDFAPYIYYRIKQVDLDDKFEYSAMKLAKRSEGPSFVVKVYPIPLENDNMVNVSVKGIDKSPMNISMTDMTGKVIRNINFTPSSESIKESFDMSPLAPGIYFIEVQNGQGKEVFKVSR